MYWEPLRKRCRHHVALDRLGKVVVHSGFETFLSIPLQGVRGHRHDRLTSAAPILRFRLQRADHPCCFVPVHHRHLTVHHHQVEPALPNAGHGLCAVRDNLRIDSKRLESPLCNRLIYRVVLDQQHACAVIVRVSKCLARQGPCFDIAARNHRQQGLQLGAAHRLRKPRRHAQSLGFRDTVAQGAENHTLYVRDRWIAAQLAQKSHSVNVGHLVVEQHHVKRNARLCSRPCGVEPGNRRRGTHVRRFFVMQVVLEDAAIRRVVIDDESLQSRQVGRLDPRLAGAHFQGHEYAE